MKKFFLMGNGNVFIFPCLSRRRSLVSTSPDAKYDRNEIPARAQEFVLFALFVIYLFLVVQ